MHNQNTKSMRKQSIQREYNFSDAELYIACTERIRYAMRDLKEFVSFGYSAEKLSDFDKLCQRFKEMPSDDEYLGEQMQSTEQKNQARALLKGLISSVMTRVANKYDVKSGKYRKFGTAKINDMSDAQFLLCGRRVARVAEQQLHFFEQQGLKQTHVDEIRKAATAFELSIHVQQDKLADRDIAVEARTEIGNEMYREFIIICNIGKNIWANVNQAKYENYTVYESNNEQKKKSKAQKESLDKSPGKIDPAGISGIPAR